MTKKTKKSRQKTINDLAKLITKTYGGRCDISVGGCMTCLAWAAFDLIDKVTDVELE